MAEKKVGEVTHYWGKIVVAGIKLTATLSQGDSIRIKGATTDILVFSRSKGLYGGLTLEGAVVATRDKLNNAYYGKDLRPSEILVLGKVSNSHADELRAAIKKAARTD